jgi:hypothetical protein
LRLPESGCLDIGGAEDGRYLVRGWYRPEDIGGVRARWAGGTTTATLRLFLEATQPSYQVRLRALAYPAGQSVTLRANKQVIGQISVHQDWTEAEVKLPSDLIVPGQIITLELIHTTMHSPFDQTAGASSDTRPLAAAYDWICFTPQSDYNNPLNYNQRRDPGAIQPVTISPTDGCSFPASHVRCNIPPGSSRVSWYIRP